MIKTYYVYILANKKYGTLYVGITNDLHRRIFEHKLGLVEGFTKRYDIKYLVYFEMYNEIKAAILREKQLKKWKRTWKIALIEKSNKLWRDIETY